MNGKRACDAVKTEGERACDAGERSCEEDERAYDEIERVGSRRNLVLKQCKGRKEDENDVDDVEDGVVYMLFAAAVLSYWWCLCRTGLHCC